MSDEDFPPAEVAVLGSMFLDPVFALEALSDLRDDDFASFKLRTLFGVLRGCHREAPNLDIVVVRAAAKKAGALDKIGGASTLSLVIEQTPSSANARHYLGIVKDSAERRRVREIAVRMAADAANEEVPIQNVVQTAVEAARSAVGSADGKTASIADALDRVVREMNDTTGVSRYSTGLSDLDHQIGGIPAKGLTIIGARPSVGKTALSLQLATNFVRRDGLRVTVYSLERDKADITRVILTQISGVSIAKIEPGAARSAEEYDRVVEAVGIVSEFGDRLRLSDSTRTSPTSIRADLARAPEGELPHVVIVDYVGLMDTSTAPGGKNRTREAEVSWLSRELKRVQQEFGIALIALAQLNRQSVNRSGDQMPQLHDLRDSGGQEQDADMVILLHRPAATATDPDERDAAGNKAFANCAKNRRGATGIVELTFTGASQTFGNGIMEKF